VKRPRTAQSPCAHQCGKKKLSSNAKSRNTVPGGRGENENGFVEPKRYRKKRRSIRKGDRIRQMFRRWESANREENALDSMKLETWDHRGEDVLDRVGQNNGVRFTKPPANLV